MRAVKSRMVVLSSKQTQCKSVSPRATTSRLSSRMVSRVGAVLFGKGDWACMIWRA